MKKKRFVLLVIFDFKNTFNSILLDILSCYL